jgi:hypothetical protein
MKSILSRVLPFLCVFFTVSILYVASQLEADGTGIGTHQQLGLEPCGFLTRFHIPCMMCGMTTSFSLYMDTQILKGIDNQPFSFVIFMITVYMSILALLDLMNPRRRIIRFVEKLQSADRNVYIALLIFFFSSWIMKIFRYTHH